MKVSTILTQVNEGWGTAMLGFVTGLLSKKHPTAALMITGVIASNIAYSNIVKQSKSARSHLTLRANNGKEIEATKKLIADLTSKQAYTVTGTRVLNHSTREWDLSLR